MLRIWVNKVAFGLGILCCILAAYQFGMTVEGKMRMDCGAVGSELLIGLGLVIGSAAPPSSTRG